MVGTALIACALAPAAAHAQAWNSASNVLAVGLPALAAYEVYQHSDTEGARQLAMGLGGTLGSTLVLKSQIHAMRPNGKDNDSMPSGHTAIAFAAARFINERYGDSVSPVLLYGAASLTGVARVRANQHHWRDVVAGGALGYAWGSWLTTPANALPAGAKVAVLPQPGGVWVNWQQVW